MIRITPIPAGFAALAAVGLVSSCAAERTYELATPVGPPPAVIVQHPPAGELAVYSSWVSSGDDESSSDYHSDYQIRTEAGALLKSVNNRVGVSGDPARVALPPGRYRVVAGATGFTRVIVPVVIEEGRTTIVHLDGEAVQGSARGAASDLVHLPNGLTVGWRASDDNQKR